MEELRELGTKPTGNGGVAYRLGEGLLRDRVRPKEVKDHTAPDDEGVRMMTKGGGGPSG